MFSREQSTEKVHPKVVSLKGPQSYYCVSGRNGIDAPSSLGGSFWLAKTCSMCETHSLWQCAPQDINDTNQHILIPFMMDFPFLTLVLYAKQPYGFALRLANLILLQGTLSESDWSKPGIWKPAAALLRLGVLPLAPPPATCKQPSNTALLLHFMCTA